MVANSLQHFHSLQITDLRYRRFKPIDRVVPACGSASRMSNSNISPSLEGTVFCRAKLLVDYGSLGTGQGIRDGSTSSKSVRLTAFTARLHIGQDDKR